MLNVRMLKTSLVATTVAALSCAVAAPPAGATSASANLTAGSLAFVAPPGAVTFSAAVTGADLSVTTTQPFDISDATGSGTGWNLTATSTTFATSPTVHTLSTSAVTSTSTPTNTCDTSVTCTLATNTITYPYTLPAAATAPTATKLYNSAANTGMGNQTVTPTWKLAIPGNAYAGSYTSTWTLSLVSAP